MVNIKIKNKKYTFDSIALAARTIIANPKDYNYNKVCRCRKEQSVKSMDVWLKKHKFTVDRDYICKDCCHTEQFTLFGKTFNTYHEACRSKYVVSKLKCSYCNCKLEKSSHHYWVRELSKNPEKELICKPCKDSRNMQRYNNSPKHHKDLMKHKKICLI